MDDGQPDSESGLESDVMFELEAAIRDWRHSFGEPLREDDRDELEGTPAIRDRDVDVR